MMRQLGNYVETACKDDMPTFLKSGFHAVSTVKTAKPPLSQFIRSITPGKNSGGMHIVPVAIAGATAYEIRWAPTVNGTPGTWTSQLVTKTRPAVTITGLTPGTNYSVQVRSFADGTGFTTGAIRLPVSAHNGLTGGVSLILYCKDQGDAPILEVTPCIRQESNSAYLMGCLN
jgi:hypothetical protein